MNTFLITFLVFGLVILAMAVGVIVTGRRIQGSCGGLNAVMTDEEGQQRCSICGITVEERDRGVCEDPATSSRD